MQKIKGITEKSDEIAQNFDYGQQKFNCFNLSLVFCLHLQTEI